MIEIRHSRTTGTLVTGTSQEEDAAGPTLTAAGYRYAPELEAWYRTHSRYRAADGAVIDRLADDLRAAGFTVAVAVDNVTPAPPVAEREAERAARAEARAERFADRADRAANASADLWGRAREMGSRIPFGQPVIADHHSTARDVRYRARIGRMVDKAAELEGKGRRWDGRAEAAAHAQRHREAVPVTLRRIEDLESQRRAITRQIQAERRRIAAGKPPEWTDEQRQAREADARDLGERITFWRERVAEAEAAGAKVWRREDFRKGDYAVCGSRCYEVLRVSGKSVTVAPRVSDGPVITHEGKRLTVVTPRGNRLSWTDRLPYDRVTGRISAEDMAGLLGA